jgi:putative ABC transport system permease protein
VLGDRLWRQRFGGEMNVVGTAVIIGDASYTIVGVMPPDFPWPEGAEAWTPVVPALAGANARWRVDTLEARHFGVLFVLGRLRPAASVDQARAELDVIARGLPQADPDAVAGSAVIVTPLLDRMFGPTRHGLVLLFAMVCLVWLIACANVSSLVLARAAALQGAMAVKTALGASRRRLVGEWMLEMGFLTAVSGAIGVVLARLALRPLLAMAPASLPGLEHVRVDASVLAFAVGLGLLTTLLCALGPAIQASAGPAANAVWQGRSTERPRPLARRGVLTAIQMALAAILLTTAGLLVRSFDRVQRIDLGFQPQHVLTLDVEPQAASGAEYRRDYDAIIERVAALPGVQAVGAVNLRPLAHGPVGADSGYLLEGQRIDRPDSWKNNVWLNFQAVTPGYFDAMRLTLRGGRVFSARDTAEAPGVAIVSASTARRLWPGRDPIGQRLSIAAGVTDAGEFPMQTVVGVVADVRYRGLADTRFDVYMPATQTQHRVKHLMVRTDRDPTDVATAVRAAVSEITRRTLVERIDTMDRVTVEAMAPWRFSMTLLTGLAAVGFVLAAMGLFALVTCAVGERSRELAVRLAIGATPPAILRMVLWQGARFAAGGLVAGLAVSLLVADRLSPLLFQTASRDPLTFGAAAALLGTTALLASYVAARRVIRIDPAAAMRAQ